MKKRTFKIGDLVYCLMYGYGVVTSTDNGYQYPLEVKFATAECQSYTSDGKYKFDALHQTLFHKGEEPNIAFPVGKLMEVSDSGTTWTTRVVFGVKNGKYLTWFHAETLEEAAKTSEVITWLQAREIQEPQLIEVTLEEIAQLKGCTIEQLRIKD